ncbi:MAG TPA: PKD domain-containing protein [Gaiellaceae bacterium]|nr:PKD domain-containing protein [Gaiellaceae bacterium]
MGRSPDAASLSTISGSGTVTITATPTATDNCAGSVAGTTADPLSYSTPGAHVVHWTYSDGNGNSSTQTQNVVLDSPPHANAGPAQTVNEGATVTLDGSASSDPDAGDTLTYAWTQTSGTPVSLAGVTGTHPTFVAPDNGTYAFQLTVTDSSGQTDTASVTITATNVNPTGTFAAPAVVDEGSTFTLALTGLSDVAADQPALATSFDCGAATLIGPGQCKAGAPGTITVKGTVTDKDGGSTTYTATVTVHNVAPIANAGGPYSGAAGAPISVTGTATDPGLPGDVLTFAWDCDNNGTTDATGATAACTYSFAGTYTAKLKVTDHDGGVGTATASVTVGLPASTAALITGAVRWARGIVTATEIISDGHHFTLGLIGYDGDGRKFASATVQSVVVTGHNATVFGRGVLIGHPLVTLSWRLDLHDGGDPGTSDTLRLRLSDGYDSSTLARVTGNLKVH